LLYLLLYYELLLGNYYTTIYYKNGSFNPKFTELSWCLPPEPCSCGRWSEVGWEKCEHNNISVFAAL